jgi:hypothetical protein
VRSYHVTDLRERIERLDEMKDLYQRMLDADNAQDKIQEEQELLKRETFVKLDRPMQGLLMATEQMRDDTLSGKKRITIREGWRDYTEGSVLIGCPTLGWAFVGHICIVRHVTMATLTEDELLDDGFETMDDAIACLSQWYPEIGPNSAVTVIRWDGESDRRKPVGFGVA